MMDHGTSTLAEARKAAGDLTDAAKNQASAAVEQAQQTATDTIHSLETSIRKNPTQAALVAAGFGLMLGLLLAR